MPKRLDVNAPYWLQIQAAERLIIEYAFEAGGDLPQAAMLLGISLPHLRRRVRVLGLSAKFGVRKTPVKTVQRRRRKQLKNQAAAAKAKAAKLSQEPGLRKSPAKLPRRAKAPPDTAPPTRGSTPDVPATSALPQRPDQAPIPGPDWHTNDQAAPAGEGPTPAPASA